ncbi:MAG: glycosyltransferase family 2 protein [Gemmatimonadales bacterium]|nr:glycosyltransferase family 2 protein [Gemmatimonadales bacterium]
MARLTVTVIAFNEERDLAACLESVRAIADEILVVDSFSTDGTPAIARSFGTLVQRPWPGFSAQRNFAAETAQGDWVLQLDADERVPPALAAEIRALVDADRATPTVYYVARRNLWLGKWIRHGGWYPDLAPRLFRKGAGQWVGHTHEVFEYAGAPGRLRHDLLHDNLKSVQEHVMKLAISTTQEVRDAERKQVRFVWLPPWGAIRGILGALLRWPPRIEHLRVAYKEHYKNRFEIVWLIPFAGVTKFLYMYVVRLGFLDGWEGLWVATLSAAYTQVRYAKLWEHFLRPRAATAALPTDEEMRDVYRRWWPSG